MVSGTPPSWNFYPPSAGMKGTPARPPSRGQLIRRATPPSLASRHTAPSAATTRAVPQQGQNQQYRLTSTAFNSSAPGTGISDASSSAGWDPDLTFAHRYFKYGMRAPEISTSIGARQPQGSPVAQQPMSREELRRYFGLPNSVPGPHIPPGARGRQ